MIRRYWEDTSRKIIVLEVDNQWTWQEFDESSFELRQMIASVEHPVFVLNDCRNVRQMPSNSIQRVYDALHEMPSNFLGHVVVTENRWIELIMKLLAQMVPEEKHKFIIVRTMEQARKSIELLQIPGTKREEASL